MQEAQHPNKLRMLLAIAGLNQREAARESGIPEGTLRHSGAGDQVIPRRDRVKLAQVLGCEMQDLAPQYNMQGDMPRKSAAKYTMTDERVNAFSSFEEWDGCFSFGQLKTTSVVLDGDGTEAYHPANIRTHYDPQPAVFFDEIMVAKEQIQQEQEEKQQRGEP